MDDDFVGTERFEIIRELGRGGMGVVYEVFDRELQTRVALKTLRTMSGEALLRFKNEFRTLQDLQHENLVSLYELFEDRGRWFFTMELIDGVDLLAYVGRARKPVSSLESTEVMTPRSDAVTEPTVSGRAPTGHVRRRAPTQVGDVSVRRLRHAFSQLIVGLSAIHAGGKVHRDVKPSNCLVTGDGRVVLLDFGLITGVTDHQNFDDDDVVGTIAYMSPEQAASRHVGPPADLYSAGVVLYEALTGTLPFTGSALVVMADKQTLVPPRPRELVAEVPEDLDQLCMDLLRTEPGDRPTAADVVDRLGADARPERRRDRRLLTPTTVSGVHRLPFVGRKRELDILDRAFADSREQGAVTVLLVGESGVGKSALVEHFTSTLPVRVGDVAVLKGRCYEREAVPYKAFDGVVDHLSQFLHRLPELEAAAVMPRRAALLSQVFPVLGHVDIIANAPRVPGEVRDPHELRHRVFAALRELLAKLAERRPLVIVIDDIQWTDADSLALLTELLRPPDTPALLLIATARTASLAGERAPLRAFTLPGDVRHVAIERLPPAEAQELARRLLPDDLPTLTESIAAIAAESGGHPLFIDELIRHTTDTGHGRKHLDLEDALWARVGQLAPEVRRLLEIACVAGGPIEQRHAAAAAELGTGALVGVVQRLRAQHLVRTTGARSTDQIEPYHARVRAAVMARLSGDTQRRAHEALAQVLEDAGVDAELLAFHWRAADHTDRAARHAAIAAKQASDALAFDRAATYYQQALERGDLTEDELCTLHTALADALTSAGRSGEAGEAYMTAAEHVDADGEPAKALDLERRGVEQLLRSGHLEAGFAALDKVLAAVDLERPKSSRAAILSLLGQRARLGLRMGLRGSRVKRRRESQITPADLKQIDVCWSVAAGIGMADPINGYGFHSRNLRLSLVAGEPYRLSRALSMESMFLSVGARKDKAATRRRTVARTLAVDADNPHARALVTMAEGVAYYWRGHWQAALEVLDRADQAFREECADIIAGSPTARVLALWSLYYLGELDELFRRVPVLLRQAEERGDLQASVNIGAGASHLIALAEDKPERAAEQVTAHIDQWSATAFHLQHWNALVAHTEIDLYRGDPAGALARLQAARADLRASRLERRVQKVRIDAQLLAARIALARAARLPAGERAAPLRRAGRALRRVERERAAWASPLARLLRAAIAAQRDDLSGARTLLTEAIAGLDEAHMALHATCARHRLGLIRDDVKGRRMVDEARAWLTERGVRNPERYLDMLAPGFAHLADR